MTTGDRKDDIQREVRRRRVGPGWFWKVVGIFADGQPIVDRERMFGDDPRNDPYRSEFDPNWKDKPRP